MKEKTGDFIMDRLLYWFVQNARQIITVLGIAICMLTSFGVCSIFFGTSTEGDILTTIFIGIICGVGMVGLLDVWDIGKQIRSMHKYIGKLYYS